jgi:hypothetical protein
MAGIDVNPYESPQTELEKQRPIGPQRKQAIVNVGAGAGAVFGMVAVFTLSAYGLISALLLIAGGAFAGCVIAGLIAKVVLRGD